MIDIFYSGYVQEIENGISNRPKVDYITSNNRLAQRVVAKDKQLNLTTKEQFYLINEQLLLLYPSKESLDYQVSQPIDLLVLSKDSYNNLDKLAKQYDIKLLVLDGTLNKEKYRLEKIAGNNKIPLHNTSRDGALEFMI